MFFFSVDIERSTKLLMMITTRSGWSRAGNFCTAKDKEGAAGKQSSSYQSEHAIPDSTHGHIGDGPLHADHRRLFVLCRPARASDVLITPGAPQPTEWQRIGDQINAATILRGRSLDSHGAHLIQSH